MQAANRPIARIPSSTSGSLMSFAFGQYCAMANNTQPENHFVTFLEAYLRQRKEEYKLLRTRWRKGETDIQYAPASWPSDKCLLTRLPAELLVLICKPLYQADLFHLAVTCRALHAYPLHLLYTHDIAHFECLSLRWACTFGIVTTLERSLSYGATANHVFEYGSHLSCSWVIGGDLRAWLCDTPLRTAVFSGEPEIIRLLLAHGADVNEPDPKSFSGGDLRWESLYPINLALGCPNMHVIEGFQPGNPLIVRCLLDAGADPNQYTTLVNHTRRRAGRVRGARDRAAARNGVTPLMMSMQTGVPVETVELLLQRGADPTLLGTFEGFFCTPDWVNRFTEGWYFRQRSPLSTVLLCSAVNDAWPFDLAKIQLLLSYGAANELSYALGIHAMPVLYRHWNHIHIAQVLERFISAGANIASWAATPIPPILSVLLWTEKFVRRVWRANDIAKLSAAMAKTRTLITLLAEATLLPPHPFSPNPRKKISSIIDTLITPGFLTTSTTVNSLHLSPHIADQTPLRYISAPFRFVGATAALAPLLLHYGADINAADSRGRTALHFAAMFTSGERVRALLQATSSLEGVRLAVDARDETGWTPLHYACLWGFWGERSGQAVTARILIDEAGADVRARTKGGWTPLGLAVFAGNAELVEVLVARGAAREDLVLWGVEGWCVAHTACTEYGEGMGMVKIGRIVLLWREDGCTEMEAMVAEELKVARVRIAEGLEQWLGITLPATWTVREPEDVLPHGHMIWNGNPEWKTPRMRVDIVNQPFGVSFIGLTGLTTQDFEECLDGVSHILDQYGLDAWIVSIRHPAKLSLLWQSRRTVRREDLAAA